MTMSRMGIMGSLRGSFLSRVAVMVVSIFYPRSRPNDSRPNAGHVGIVQPSRDSANKRKSARGPQKYYVLNLHGIFRVTIVTRARPLDIKKPLPPRGRKGLRKKRF